MPRPRKYKPTGKMLAGPKTVLREAEYWELLSSGRRIPAGAQIRIGVAPERTLKELKVRFRADGSMEFPFYTGPETKLKKTRVLHAKTVSDGVRLVYHQIGSVKSRIGQAERILDRYHSCP